MSDLLERPADDSVPKQEAGTEDLTSTALVYPQPLQAVSAAFGVDMTVVSNLVPGANTGSNALSRLVQGWENYMNDAKDQPLKMLQDLQLCGEEDLNLLTDGPSSFTQHLMQPELRHIRSSPLHWRPSVFDQEVDNEESNAMPPPIPLDPMQRSSSTPSSFRQNSMCTSIGTEGRSAFTLPSQRVNYTSSVTHPRRSAFDPVKYYAWQLEDMERTSIEVMDMTPDKGPEEVVNTPQKRGAASRAARFLEDVRVLRRRRRFGGKGKKGQQAGDKTSAKADDKAESLSAPDTSITVITESDFDSSLPVPSGEVYSPPINDMDVAKNKTGYAQLDSDMEEEPYQRIETQLQSESPNSSLSHHQLVGDRSDNNQDQKQYEHSLRIKFSSVDKQLETLPSPSPTRMATGDASETESPVTARSSATGSSSGHTTQAASIVSSIGPSGLSTISETDREVMQANKEAKRRRASGLNGTHTKNESDLASVHSSSTGSSATHGYLALDHSPIPLRDGANVPLERFFTGTSVSAGQVITSFVRSQVSGMSRTQSGTTTSASTSESTSGTHTTASISSQEEPPPTFVSYLERLPELVSVRETVESSSPRATGNEGEEREDSPAEMGNLLFEVAKTSFERKLKSSSPTTSQRVRLDKFRVRPPRSPYMIPRSTSTPSPRSSPLIIHHSPPRNIVDKPEPFLVSRPHVTRSGTFVHANTFSLGRCMTAFEEEEEITLRHPKLSFMSESMGIASDAMDIDETYHDESIEVLKCDSSETMLTVPTLVTPDKAMP